MLKHMLVVENISLLRKCRKVERIQCESLIILPPDEI